MDKQLLALLVCPENQTPLRPAGDQLLGRLKQATAAGGVVNRAGQTVTEPLEAGLVREDNALLYPIVEELPVMLPDEAIPLDQIP